jgi:hypothetical protein
MTAFLATRVGNPNARVLVCATNPTEAANRAEDHWRTSDDINDRLHTQFDNNLDAYRAQVANEWRCQDLRREDALDLIIKRLDGEVGSVPVIL